MNAVSSINNLYKMWFNVFNTKEVDNNVQRNKMVKDTQAYSETAKTMKQKTKVHTARCETISSGLAGLSSGQ